MRRFWHIGTAAIGTALAVAAPATTTRVDTTVYLAAPKWADGYIKLRTSAYVAALTPAADGRVLGHLSYPAAVAAPVEALVGIEARYRTKQCDMLEPAAKAAEAMIAAANAAIPAGTELRAQSCFRSIAEQVGIFCNKVRSSPSAKCVDPVVRARSSAPPGYSEHATGYALDLVSCRTKPKLVCGDLDAGFAASDAGKWLLAHAGEFGFELSFPKGNIQGVTYEPWHWRWVGRHGEASPDVARARGILAAARRCFPARPGIDQAAAPLSIQACLTGS